MNWTNVILILHREVRDQLRDRRMLFMIFVLPLLLYPLMGLSVAQLAQFLQEHPPQILIVDPPTLDGYDPLLKAVTIDGRATSTFADDWKKPSGAGDQVPIETLDRVAFDRRTIGEAATAKEPDDAARAKSLIDREQAEVVVVFPADFAQTMAEFQKWIVAEQAGEAVGVPPKMSHPKIYANSAKDKSMLAKRRVEYVLDQWQEAIGRRHLRAARVPLDALKPFEFDEVELAAPQQKSAATWSKILPMLLIIWALTGAFYPAIDLCAGEKERGTLETLLTSPAEREEIVAGKMLTVTLFSLLTSLLNLVSIGATGMFVMGRLQGMSKLPTLGLPPIESLAMMGIALVPVAVLFSALCIALASYARSNKEGQYYLMPLMMVVLPLTLLPLDPRMELSLGNALIPISGLMLILRGVLEGEYLKVLPFIAPVALVTGLCCWLSVRWAVDQFNREEILFRESERFDLKLWLKHLFSEKRETPTPAMAIACVVLMFIIKFYLEFALAGRLGADDSALGLLAKLVLITQLVVMLAPALIMAVTLTTKPLKTLLIRNPHWAAIPLAVVLAVLLHPSLRLLAEMLQSLYPIAEETKRQIQGLENQISAVPLGWGILFIAVVPGICEELAFRGFVLSGLRHWGGRMSAIVATAALFGLIHGILQQSIAAVAAGIVLGYLAVKTQSIFPCIAFHIANNSLVLLVGAYAAERKLVGTDTGIEKIPPQLPIDLGFDWMFQLNAAGELERFQPSLVILGLLASGVVLAWFGRLPSQDSTEEALFDKINRNRSLEMT